MAIRVCLCKALLRERECDTFAKWRYEIRAVIKYFCKKGIPPKEIHENFMETLGKGSPFLKQSDKNGQQSLRGEKEH